MKNWEKQNCTGPGYLKLTLLKIRKETCGKDLGGYVINTLNELGIRVILLGGGDGKKGREVPFPR